MSKLHWIAKILIVTAMSATISVKGADEIRGDAIFPEEWVAFGPFERDDPIPETGALLAIPETLRIGDTTAAAKRVTPVVNQYDFSDLLGEPPYGRDRVAYVYLTVDSPEDQTVTVGLNADYQFQLWLNGEQVADTTGSAKNPVFPPSIRDFLFNVDMRKGENLMVVRIVSGAASSLLVVGGPRELRHGRVQSIYGDPFLKKDPFWTANSLRVVPDEKEAVRIDDRLELFVDDYLISGMSGGAVRELHHPVPRETVHRLDMPWEGKTSAYLSVFQDGDRVVLTYNATPRTKAQTTALLMSEDGIHFERPVLGLVDFGGSKKNNLLPRRGASGHNFTMFRDPNPAAPETERYKAISYFPGGKGEEGGGGLGAWVSPDLIQWELANEKRIITRNNPETGELQGGFDSQNLAFWDPVREIYVCYYRGPTPSPDDSKKFSRVRGIWRSESPDFRHWSIPRPIAYTDLRQEDMYTNAIRPYFRAPHIYIGTPNRYVPGRTKYPDWQRMGSAPAGINDAILMSSRDGITFERWQEGFLRPATDPEVWTDRNNYFAWGMIQTGPDEISLYWTEHYRHDGMRIRRGTLRLDGFVSLHAGAEQVGEVLTRPLIFSGDRLELNYATSAIGTIRIELCDEDGNPYPGFSFRESQILFGNEIAATYHWSDSPDLSSLAGKPVRLRIRLHDADLYSIRFPSDSK